MINKMTITEDGQGVEFWHTKWCQVSNELSELRMKYNKLKYLIGGNKNGKN